MTNLTSPDVNILPDMSDAHRCLFEGGGRKANVKVVERVGEVGRSRDERQAAGSVGDG